MDSAVAGLIGAAVGAVSGFAGTLLTSWISLTKEREQSKRNTRIEKDQWLRDRLQEIYGNSGQTHTFLHTSPAVRLP